jgi:uncharacterized protein YjeT (DUF2065 family)
MWVLDDMTLWRASFAILNGLLLLLAPSIWPRIAPQARIVRSVGIAFLVMGLTLLFLMHRYNH